MRINSRIKSVVYGILSVMHSQSSVWAAIELDLYVQQAEAEPALHRLWSK